MRKILHMILTTAFMLSSTIGNTQTLKSAQAISIKGEMISDAVAKPQSRKHTQAASASTLQKKKSMIQAIGKPIFPSGAKKPIYLSQHTDSIVQDQKAPLSFKRRDDRAKKTTIGLGSNVGGQEPDKAKSKTIPSKNHKLDRALINQRIQKSLKTKSYVSEANSTAEKSKAYDPDLQKLLVVAQDAADYDDYYEGFWGNNYRSDAYDLSYNEGDWLGGLHGYGIQWDDDYYEIQVDPNYLNLVVDLRFTHSDGDIDLKVYDSSGNQVASSTSTSDDEYIDVTLSHAGTYYIRVYYDDDGNEYDMQWATYYTGPSDDYYEPNDSQGSAYDLRSYENYWLSSIHGYGIQDDEDWYQIQVDQGYEEVVVDLRFTHSQGDIDVQLVNDYGNVVAQSRSTNDDEYIDYIVPSYGTYYIRVYYGNNANSYDMKWYTESTRPTFVEDSYENNDSAGSAYSLIDQEDVWLEDIRGFGAQFDEDWYKIEIVQGWQRVRLETLFEDDYGDIDVQLIDKNGVNVLASARSTDDDEYIDYTVNEPGIYYVRIFYGNTGNYYNFRWFTQQGGDDSYEPNDSRGSAYNLSNYEDTWLSNIHGWGVQWNDDWYKVHVDPGYLILNADLRFQHSAGDLDLQIVDANNQVVAQSRSSDNDEYIRTPVPAAGDYWIRVFYANHGTLYDLSWYTEYSHSNTSTPNAPTGLNSSVASQIVTLAWSWSDPNYDPDYSSIDGYKFEIQRKKVGGADWSTIDTLTNMSLNGYSNSGLVAGTYMFRVRASNNNGASGWSNETTAVVGTTPPTNVPALGGLYTYNTTNSKLTGWAYDHGSATSLIDIVLVQTPCAGKPASPKSLGSIAANKTAGARLPSILNEIKTQTGITAPSNYKFMYNNKNIKATVQARRNPYCKKPGVYKVRIDALDQQNADGRRTLTLPNGASTLDVRF